MLSRSPWQPPTEITDPTPGVLQTAALLWRSPTRHLRELHARYGDVVATHPAHLGRVVFFSHPDAVREIFTADPEVLRAGEGNGPLRPVFGDHSMLLLDGAEHQRHRRLLMPPFHGKRLAGMITQMEEITQRGLELWPRDRSSFALQPSMLGITLEVILRLVFGVDDQAQFKALAHELEELLELISGRWAIIMLTPQLQRDLGSWYPWNRFKVLRARVDALIFEHIARRRLTPDPDGERSDILSMLLEARDDAGQPMTDGELRDELMTLLLAGHETTATAMSWAFERLLQRSSSHALSTLRAEIDGVLGDAPVSDTALREMPYLGATVKEVLRFRPVIPFILRLVKEPITIGGVDLPAGVRVAATISVTHHRPDVYEVPWAFKPERFLERRLDPYTWLPFGGGTRRCIGRTFAQLQMKIMLATILQRFDLELVEDGPLASVQRNITSAPRGGTPVRAEPRRSRRG